MVGNSDSFLGVSVMSLSQGRSQAVTAVGYFSGESCQCPQWRRSLGSMLTNSTESSIEKVARSP